MPKKTDEQTRPQDDPDYQDAGQAGAAAVNEEQAAREAEAAKEAAE